MHPLDNLFRQFESVMNDAKMPPNSREMLSAAFSELEEKVNEYVVDRENEVYDEASSDNIMPLENEIEALQGEVSDLEQELDEKDDEFQKEMAELRKSYDGVTYGMILDIQRELGFFHREGIKIIPTIKEVVENAERDWCKIQ